ncbi:MAG: hypothetical protein R3C52_11755 [Hyphomonadaceae bacterium]
MKLKAAAMAAVMVLTAGAAMAQSERGAELGQCLVDTATEADEQSMRTVLLQALQDQTDELNRTLIQFSLQVLSRAVDKCGLKFSELESPEVEEGIGIYGEYLGQKIFEATLAKIGG